LRPVEDSIPGIFTALQEAAVTMQQGGGIGRDFSTLRPQGVQARGVGNIASGPVSFMQVWDAMGGIILLLIALDMVFAAQSRIHHCGARDLRGTAQG
jgi:ribonucleoside-diphosphate reductase alpha chain